MLVEHGWLTKRHSEHPTTDFSLLDAPRLWAATESARENVILPTLQQLFFGEMGGATLVINDLFYVRYDARVEGPLRPRL